MLEVLEEQEDVMQLQLTDDEAVALRDALTNRVTDLTVEIRHTDKAAFRDQLRERRDLLRRLCGQLTDQLTVSR
jgi:hypothetical protein